MKKKGTKTIDIAGKKKGKSMCFTFAAA